MPTNGYLLLMAADYPTKPWFEDFSNPVQLGILDANGSIQDLGMLTQFYTLLRLERCLRLTCYYPKCFSAFASPSRNASPKASIVLVGLVTQGA